MPLISKGHSGRLKDRQTVVIPETAADVRKPPNGPHVVEDGAEDWRRAPNGVNGSERRTPRDPVASLRPSGDDRRKHALSVSKSVSVSKSKKQTSPCPDDAEWVSGPLSVWEASDFLSIPIAIPIPMGCRVRVPKMVEWSCVFAGNHSIRWISSNLRGSRISRQASFMRSLIAPTGIEAATNGPGEPAIGA